MMTTLRGEFVYTQAGRMRPVFLHPRCTRARFVLELMDGDKGRVEATHDPAHALKKGGAVWHEVGDMGGGLFDATALRVVLDRLDGWARLIVEQEMDA